MEISTGKMKKQVEEINRNSTSPLSGCTYEGSSSSSSVEFTRNFRKNWFDLKCKDIVEKYAKLLSKYKNCYNRLQLKFAEENLLKEENWKLKDENMDILILISSMEKDHISATTDCPTVVGSESAEAEKPTRLTLAEKLVPQLKAKSAETDKPSRFPLAGKEVLQLKAKNAEADKSTRFPLAGKEVLQLKPKIAEADKPARLTVAEKLVPQWKAKSAEAEKPARLTVAEKLVPQWKAKSAEAEKLTRLPVAEEPIPELKAKSAEADKPTRLPLAAKPAPQLMAKSVDEKDNGVELLEVYKQGTTKTEICTKWEKTGVCPYKNRCQFAHGVEELRPVIRHPRYKTEVCRMITNGPGTCPFGHRCHFRHSLNPEEAGVKVLV